MKRQYLLQVKETSITFNTLFLLWMGIVVLFILF